MSHKNLSRPRVALGLTLIFALALAPPVAAAPSANADVAASAAVAAVGRFVVTPLAAGLVSAEGAITSTVVQERRDAPATEPVLRGYSVLGVKAIDALTIHGFRPTAALEGEGTAVISLEGNGTLVQAYDSANALLRVQNRGNAAIAVALALSETVSVEMRSPRLVRLADGNVLTAHVAIANALGGSARGSIESTSRAGGELQARLEAGEELVFRATPSRGVGAGVESEEEAFAEVVASALVEGRLVAEVTSQLRGAEALLAQATYAQGARLAWGSVARGHVETRLQAEASAIGQAGARLLAYDLDYVDLPARTAAQVAVYVNGKLAARAETASEAAAAGTTAAAYALAAAGRTLVLVNPGASAQAAATAIARATVTLAAIPEASVPPATVAELEARYGLSARVAGAFHAAEDARGRAVVTGHHVVFAALASEAAVGSVALPRAGVEVFERIALASEATARSGLDATSRARFLVEGGAAEIVMRDDARYPVTVDATSASTVAIRLAEGLSAHALSRAVVEVASGTSVIGHLVLASAANGAGGALVIARAGTEATANLAAGHRLLFRAAPEGEGEARSRQEAHAIASGDVASEITLGVVANAVETAVVDHSSLVRTRVEKAVRGEVVARVERDGGAAREARLLLVTADRASLLAQSAGDVRAWVDGEAAARVASATEAIAFAQTEGRAAASVVASAHGLTEVAIALPAGTARATTDVLVRSTLQAERERAAAIDTFGGIALDATTGAAQGELVAFTARPAAAAIFDYTVTTRAATRTVFDAIVLSGGALGQAAGAQAAAAAFANAESEMRVHDASSALVAIDAKKQTSATFRLAAGMAATARSDGLVLVEERTSEGAQILGALALVAEGEGRSRLSIASAEEVRADLAAGATLVFRAFGGFESELEQSRKAALADALAAGRVAGHVIFLVKGGTAAAAGVPAHAEMALAGGVAVATTIASRERVEVVVEHALAAGKTLLVSLDPHTVPALATGKADVRVDGRVAAQAASYSDVLDPSNDGGRDEYFVHATEVGYQVLVSLAHFSTRTITLEAQPPVNVFMLTTIALGIVVAGQAIYPAVRRRTRRA